MGNVYSIMHGTGMGRTSQEGGRLPPFLSSRKKNGEVLLLMEAFLWGKGFKLRYCLLNQKSRVCTYRYYFRMQESMQCEIESTRGEIDMNIGKLGNLEGWRRLLDLHKSGDELSSDLHKFGNELSSDLHKFGNELSLDLHKSGNELSLDLHKSGNELSLDLHKSSNESSTP